MKYIDYVRETLQSYTDRYNIVVVEEIDNNYNPKDNDIIVVYKKLAGAVNGNVRFMPIQFEVYSANNEVNDTMEIFNRFVDEKSNTSFVLGLDYMKQDYNTPVDMTNFLEVGSGFRAYIYVSGTLMITSNISDVKGIKINGKEINYTNVAITYVAQATQSKKSGDNLQTSMLSNANLQITITGFCNADVFNSQLSLIRQGVLSPNTEFSVELTFTDNDFIETYNCRVINYTKQYDITNPPTKVVVFVRA